jgi:dipeptidyl aminopeptidase/acylaminoacyl peptidase
MLDRRCVRFALAILWGAVTPAMAAGCGELGNLSRVAAPLGRLLTAEDLVRLRDIGPVDPSDATASILAVSPDKTRVAFQMRQANLEQNTYCFGMFVLDVSQGGTPLQVDSGGSFVPVTRSSLQGFASFTSSGASITVTPHWSPDGRSIAYLRRDGAYTQIWVAQADGTGSRAVTAEPFDVLDLIWSADGSRIVFSGRPALEAAKATITAEGAEGFLFDDRFVPANSNRPLPREPIPTDVFSVDVPTRKVGKATTDEISLLLPVKPPSTPHDAQLTARLSNGAWAWTYRQDRHDINASNVLEVQGSNGGSRRWTAPRGMAFTQLWSTEDGQSIVFMTFEGPGFGWNSEMQGLYVWTPGESAPHEVLKTEDVLIGCQVVGGLMICGHEAATQPRELVSISLRNGVLTRLYDPNPEIQALRLGSVRRLNWRNDRGLDVYGDLVLPPDHQVGQRHPLIVVQYRSRGFLRGGTGDEYPIQFYAARGFSVLSVNHPASISTLTPFGAPGEAAKANLRNWADRKSIESALESGVQAAIATGTVDAGHIGLTGLSDGATSAQFAVVNSSIFSAVAISTCCDEPSVTGMLAGPAAGRYFQGKGYPSLDRPNPDFWRNYSLRFNVGKVQAPILIQAADVEYLGALEAYTALREAGKPVEMYVYPDEFHVKWQPLHRLASYRRSLDWFDYWLKDKRDPVASKADQYRRWDKLKGGNLPEDN